VSNTIDPASIRANQQRLGVKLQDHYDFVVCGAGSSGSVVAGQLAANPNVRVLLLEAGGSDDVGAVLDPNQWPSTLGSELDWGFIAEPNSHLNGRAIPYSMGKVLGGGGSINVGIWARGHQADWDFFAEAAGDPAWSHAAVLDLYRRIEAPPHRDADMGPMWVQAARNPHPFFAAALDSMDAQGIQRFETMNGALWEAPSGCAYVDETVHAGKRQSPFRSYVYSRMDQPNLTVLTGALVTRVLFQDRRAAGVEFAHDGKQIRVQARLEIVLSLGALHTSKVLMQSGIGDERKLRPFGIPVLQHLPGVGRHMHDHASLSCVWESPEIDMPTAPRGQAVCFWKTDPAMSVPNALAFAVPIVYATPENAATSDLPKAGWSLFAGFTTEGRGELHLTGPNATDQLRIETNFISEPHDIESALEVIGMCRRIGNEKALAPFVKREALPGELDRASMEMFIRNGIGTFWHQSGAARMGRDDMSVVDSRLRVYGIDGLRIADASVMPRVTVGNTMAPCVIIGQRAADMIQAANGS